MGGSPPGWKVKKTRPVRDTAMFPGGWSRSTTSSSADAGRSGVVVRSSSRSPPQEAASRTARSVARRQRRMGGASSTEGSPSPTLGLALALAGRARSRVASLADVPRLHARATGAARGAARLLHSAHDPGPPGGALLEGGGRAPLPRGAPPDGPRRLAGDRLAAGVRGPGPLAARAVHLLRRGAARRLPPPLPHPQHGRPDHHGVRHAGAEALLPASYPRRRVSLLDRLFRAGGGYRSRLAPH